MSRQIKVPNLKEPGEREEKIEYHKTILRWPWWIRIKIYKKIATMMLNDEIGFGRAQTLSLQKFINLACAKKLGLPIVEEDEIPISEDTESTFMMNYPKDLHKQIMTDVYRIKLSDDPKETLNSWTKDAALKYLDEL